MSEFLRRCQNGDCGGVIAVRIDRSAGVVRGNGASIMISAHNAVLGNIVAWVSNDLEVIIDCVASSGCLGLESIPC